MQCTPTTRKMCCSVYEQFFYVSEYLWTIKKQSCHVCTGLVHIASTLILNTGRLRMIMIILGQEYYHSSVGVTRTSVLAMQIRSAMYYPNQESQHSVYRLQTTICTASRICQLFHLLCLRVLCCAVYEAYTCS